MKTNAQLKQEYFDVLGKYRHALDQAKTPEGSWDLSRVESLEGSVAEKRTQLDELEQRLTDLDTKLAEIANFEEKEREMRRREASQVAAVETKNVSTGLGFDKFISDYARSEIVASKSNVGYHGDVSLKALFNSTDFTLPSSFSGVVVPAVSNPVTVIDQMPQAPTNQPSVVYMVQSTRTNAAAARAEGSNLVESTIVYTQTSKPIVSIGSSLAVTQEILDDVPQLEMLLANDLRFMVRQAVDDMLINGDSSTSGSQEFDGLDKISSTQTVAKGATEYVTDAFLGAKVKCQTIGGAQPNAVLVNPADWEKVQKLKDVGAAVQNVAGDALVTYPGSYIWGHPSQVGPRTLWGMTVVECPVVTAGKAWVGDFARFSAIRDRQSVTLQIGESGQDFEKLQRTLRCYVRMVGYFTRATAFCSVTAL